MSTLVASTTADAVKYVKDNLERLGELRYIEHSRNSNKIEYKTIIVGEINDLVIEGGLGSGYTGEGPSGLLKVLILLGIDNETANKLVYENTQNTYTFKHEF